jgi:hypothetical protein
VKAFCCEVEAREFVEEEVSSVVVGELIGS